jgi:hypothetical protein
MNDASIMSLGDGFTHACTDAFRVVVFEKGSGILCKKISLADDGTAKSDGSECRMSVGTATLQTHDLRTFAGLIEGLEHQHAIALGAFREGIPDRVRVETKSSRNRSLYPDGRPADLIVRSADHIAYLPGQPALLLIDVDAKAMPGPVRERIRNLGGYWDALVATLPALASVGHLTRPSTSTGLSRTDTRERLPGSEGQHIYVLAADGADIDRTLRALHDRCWLAGFGWLMVGRAGQFLARSIVDRMVGVGERLVFEAPALTVAPLVQDQVSRKPVVVDGPAFDTKSACPDLTVVQRERLRELVAAEKQRLAPEAAKAKADFIERMAARIVEKAGGEIEIETARHIVERQTNGVLLPNVVLETDNFGEITVADVLADPDRYVGATLADPLEGPEYGYGKAIIMQRVVDGSLHIHSFAHGEAFYRLAHDVRSTEKAILAAPEDKAASVLVGMVADADLDPLDETRLKAMVCQRDTKTKPKPLGEQIKIARAAATQRRKEEARQEQDARRTAGQRVRLDCPSPSGERTPVMAQLNEVLGSVDGLEPPMRDIDSHMTQVVVRRLPHMHALTSAGANDEETADMRVQAVEMPLLSRLDECELSELIERHIEFQNAKGAAVTLPAPFVKHYVSRKTDDALPFCAAIATLPMVTRHGTLLAKQGLDRDSGILFRIAEPLMAALPKSREQCDDAAILAAMKRLCDEWLVDVSVDLAGKATLLTAAGSIIERTLLSDRPIYFVTAPRRGGGKTTVLVMILVAITGIRPAAAAWSTNEEERRKALMAYLLEALPAIIWDNIPRGSQISCPHIEKSCTSEFLSDRKLGVSENIVASAASIHLFTGNNIAPKGDTASRSLTAMLTVSRPDPENRPFKHVDPIGWTKTHRYQILADIFTILLGNPKLRSNYEPPTRFKDWMRLVGSAFEHAATLYRQDAINGGADAGQIPRVNFTDLFLRQDDEDEQSADLVAALVALSEMFPPGRDQEKPRGEFEASHLAARINNRDEQRSNEELARVAVLREFLYPERTGFANENYTPISVGKRLKRHLGEPVQDSDKRILILKEAGKSERQPRAAGNYWVSVSQAEARPASADRTPSDSMPF